MGDSGLGNPPWLSYRYVQRSDYQSFLKTQITKEYRLVQQPARHLMTHLELGTLFLVRCAHLYLRDGGEVGFVLPKSIFSADQHHALRCGTFKRPKPFSVQELWDLEAVTPLFNQSAAVLFAVKAKDRKSEPSVAGEALAGELPTRNCSLAAAEKVLSSETVTYQLSVTGDRSYWSTGPAVQGSASPYKDLFVQGASIVPRCFWFVQLQRSAVGFDASTPPLVSADRARKQAKNAYKGCVIRGQVERQFIYATALSADMVPFGFLRLRPVVLPVRIRHGGFVLYDAAEARRQGFLHLAAWLDTVQTEWEHRRGEKAKNMSAIEWLNYRHKLTEQRTDAAAQVLYATSGTNVCSCVIDTRGIGQCCLDGLTPRAFAADTKTFHAAMPGKKAAAYLAAFLNARVVNELIKPSQSRGLWGARDIHTKVLDLPIPEFDESDEDHQRLASLGQACADRVATWVEQGGPGSTRSIGHLRRRVRKLLEQELAQIDAAVRPLLGL